MTAENQPVPHPPLQITDNILVFVRGREVDELQVHGPEGVNYIGLKNQQAERLSAALAAMYLDLGPDEHPSRLVSQRSGLNLNSFRPTLKLIEQLLPRDVAQVISAEETGGEEVVRFGSFAIANKRPTAEEAREARQRRKAERDLPFELFHFDHVLVTTHRGEFLLPIDSPTALLAARVVRAVSQLPDQQLKRSIGWKPLALQVWSEMSEGEKRLFTDDEVRLQSLGVFLTSSVKEILHSLTTILGITDTVKDRTVLKDNNIKMTFQLMPSSQEFLDSQPSDFQIVQAQEVSAQEVSPPLRPSLAPPDPAKVRSMLEAAEAVLSYDGLPTYERAFQILAVMMPKEGKEAIRQILARNDGANLDAETELARLWQEAREILGEATDIAKDDRTIDGWNAVTGIRTGRVRLGSSVDPGTTNAVTRWVVGTISESSPDT